MKKNTHYRQGDVLIERIAELPDSAKQQKVKGPVILAHGEVTGHAHAFVDGDARAFKDAAGVEYYDVVGRPIRANLPIIRRWNDQVLVNHPQLGMIEFAVCDITIEKNRAVIDGAFGLLTHLDIRAPKRLQHEDHHTAGIPAGLYQGGTIGTGARDVQQREYTPQEIRRAQD